MTRSRQYGKQDNFRVQHAAVRGAYVSVVAAAALGLVLRVGTAKLPIRYSPTY